MPKSMFYNQNQAALSKSANYLAGDVNEFVPYNATVVITAVCSATGMRLSAFADSDLLVDDKEIPFIGTTLVSTDHIIDSFSVSGGTRLAITTRETANDATRDTYVGVEIIPE